MDKNAKVYVAGHAGLVGSAMLKKLKIYAGGSHDHAAQCPKVISFSS